MCIYSPTPHKLSYCALIGKCALIRSNTVYFFLINRLVTSCHCPVVSIYFKMCEMAFSSPKHPPKNKKSILQDGFRFLGLL